jgi:hypothetical protein
LQNLLLKSISHVLTPIVEEGEYGEVYFFYKKATAGYAGALTILPTLNFDLMCLGKWLYTQKSYPTSALKER